MEKFETGKIYMTAGISESIEKSQPFADFVARSLKRYVLGDWGELDKDDADLNDEAVKTGGRILAAYKQGDAKIWIITEYDRSCTTILYPEEY